MKRLLSALLSALLVLTMLPVPALAEVAEELDALDDAALAQGQPTEPEENDTLATEDDEGAAEASPDPADPAPDSQDETLLVQTDEPKNVWLDTLEEWGWVGNQILVPMAHFRIQAGEYGESYDWYNATDTITFTSASDSNVTYEVLLNADKNTIDGLFYEAGDMMLPLPAGSYTITFTGEDGLSFTTTDRYTVNEGDGYIFVANYQADGNGGLKRDALHAYEKDSTDECDLINLDDPVDLRFQIKTATDLGDAPAIGSIGNANAQLVMYKAQDSEGHALTLEELGASLAQDDLSAWPALSWLTGTVIHPQTTVWWRTGTTAGTNGTTWSFTRTDSRTGTFAINNIALGTAASTASALEEGVYFPVLRVSIDGLLYYFAYNPVEVAHVVVARKEPTITTPSLPSAMKNVPYATTLAGRTGVPAEQGGGGDSTFSWAVTSGSLPRGLELDAATGAITGTPTSGATTQTITVTLTETAGDVSLSASKEYTVAVLEEVSLGAIAYPKGTIWTRDDPQDFGNNKTLHLSVPISANIADEELGLSQSRVHCVVRQTSTSGHTSNWGPSGYGGDIPVTSCISSDGKTLQIDASIQSDTATIDRIEVNLYLYGDDGEPVLGPSEDGQGEGDPLVISSVVRNPEVHIGGWAEFCALDFGTDEYPTTDGRVTIWPYDGTTRPAGEVRVEEIDVTYGAQFALEPGEYAFTLEGAAYLKDEEGNLIWDDEEEDYQHTWVDIMKGSSVARAIAGTRPRQFVFTVSPNQGVVVDHELSTRNFDFHTVTPLFQTADKTSYKENLADYEVSWYRYDPSRVGREYVLVGKGDTVSLEASEEDLYVEVRPTGRDAAFWKSSGKQKVPSGSLSCTVRLDRKPLFTATVHLSNTEGRVPEDGQTWGIVEVSTPLESGGWASSSIWAYEGTIEVDNVTSGSLITYTPSVSLLAGQVEYEVPEGIEDDFETTLVAPLPEGLVTFEDLTYVRADDASTTDDDAVEDRTVGFSLDDGRTTVKVTYRDAMYGVQSVPFYLADGTRIVIQHQNKTYFREGGTYTVEVRHYEDATTESIGVDDKDYVARTSCDVVLDQKLQATASVQVTQPGSVVVPLSNPGSVGCDLLLYDAAGKLVQTGSAGDRKEVSTPLLEAGSYTLYAMDSNWFPKDESDFSHKGNLDSYLLELRERNPVQDEGQDVEQAFATSLALTVEEGKRTRSASGLVFPQWNATNLVNRDGSSVTATLDYGGHISIAMHAELLEGVVVSDDAYLEVVTNQKTDTTAAGYTAPRALTINGTGLSLNRWSDLLDNACMDDGSLRIRLAEAAKTSPTCREFPMDMTLVVPREDATKTEVSIWLVSDGEQRRSLVGSYSETFGDVSITAPKAVAWGTFWVYGQTAPGAEVTIYTNGMRSSHTQADTYGYYTAEVALPSGIEEFDEFSVSATAQWFAENGKGGAATSQAETVTYTTLFPVIERITMCYQPGEDSTYEAVESYYRGRQSAKYRSVYRAIYSQNKNDRGKVFWLVEFENGSSAKNVRVNIPRSNGTTEVQTSDSLEDAAAWIADVRESSSDAGKLVRRALLGTQKRAFVSKPVSPSVSPDEVRVTFDVDEATSWEPYSTTAPRRYEGYRGAGHEDLTAFVQALRDAGHLYTCTTAEECDELPAPASTQAAALISAPEGTVDEWLMVSNEADGDGQEWVQVHHQVTSSDKSVRQIQAEVRGIRAAADPVTAAYELWLDSEGANKTQGATTYKGATVVFALGNKYTLTSSDDYCIATKDSNGDYAVELMNTHTVEESDARIYQFLRFDRASLTCITWNEATGQRQVLTYTIADDCLSNAGSRGYDGEPGLGYYDIMYQWAGFQGSLYASLNAAADALDNPDLLTQSVGSDESATDDDGALLTQGGPSSVVKGKADSALVGAARKRLGIKDETEIAEETTAARQNSQIDELGNNYINKYSIEGDQLSRLRDAVMAGKDYFEAKAFDLVNTIRTANPKSVIDPWTYIAWDTLGDPANDIIRKGKRWYNKTIEYRIYRQQKKLELVGLPNHLNYYRYKAPKALVNDFAWRLKEDEDWLRFVDAYNARMKLDPSGIVYEAVLSNPVQGATVTLYTYNASDGVASFANTKEFGAEDNPQTTGADGRYQWFVPEGLWQVRVSKEGYQSFSTGDAGHEETRLVYDGEGNPTTQTVWAGDYGLDATNDMDGNGVDDGKGYWMPVLPVQLDVNIPLVSTAAPRIASFEPDETGVTVTFSKYLVLDTVSAGMFALDGEAPASMEAIDAEAAGDGSGVMLARSFRLAYPGGALADVGAEMTLRFHDADGATRSYAGVAMDEGDRAYEQTEQVRESRVSIEGATIALASTALTYTGSALEPAVTSVVVGGQALDAGVDYDLVSYDNNVDPGTATVSVVGLGTYKGSASTSFRITCPVSKLSVTAPAAQTYTGKALTPEPVVKRGSVMLKKGTDYTLSYASNTNAGTATVTVAGKGAYTGTRSVNFQIKPAASTISIAAQAKTYTGKALAYSGKVTRTGSAGAVTYKYYSDAACTKAVAAANVKAAGTYYVRATVAARGNYAAATSKAAAFTIKRAASSVKLAAQTKTYTGKALAYSGKVTRTGSAGKVSYAYYSDAACKKAVKAADVRAARTYYVRATVAAAGNYAGATSAAAKLVVAKAANPLAVRAAARTASARALRSKAVAVDAPAVASGGRGKLAYAKASGSAALTVSASTGKVTVRKGTKAGKYAIKVKVSAAGDANHRPGAKTVSCTVTVK